MFTILETTLDLLLPRLLSKFYSNVASYIAVPLSVAVGFHALWQGILYLRGRLQVTLPEIGWMGGKAALIATMATQWDVFNKNIFVSVWEVHQSLGTKILTSFAASLPVGSGHNLHVGAIVNGAMMDLALATAMVGPAAIYGAVQAQSNIALASLSPLGLPIGQVAAGLLELAAVGFFFAAVLLMMLVSKLLLLLAVALAPIFIGCYLFETTRPIADSWTRTLLGLIITPACIQVAFAITFPVILLLNAVLGVLSVAGGLSASAAALHAAGYMVIYGGLGALLFNLPSFASGLVGSMAGGTAGYVAQHNWGATAERHIQPRVDARVQGATTGQANPGAANAAAAMHAVHDPVRPPPVPPPPINNANSG